MEIWLDTIDLKTLKLGHNLGILSGVTTNPSLISASKQPLEKILSDILQVQNKPITVQVTAPDHSSIIEQGEILREFSEKIIVKIPVTQEGLKAIKTLSHLQFPIMATTIFTPNQALFACHAGAKYLAPYYSGMDSPIDALEEILFLLDNYDFDAKLVVASLQSLDDIHNCLELGVDAITIKKNLFDLFIGDHPYTFERLEKFSRDWKKAIPSKLLK